MEKETVAISGEIESSKPKDFGEVSGQNTPNNEAVEDALKEIRI